MDSRARHRGAPPARLILLSLPLLAFAACGSDSGGRAPTAPPPHPLSWTDVPELETLKVGEQKEISLSLSAAVAATYSHSASNANVEVAGESLRNGIYRLRITGVESGEATITVTAMANGYETATATFPVMVALRPLAWSVLPEDIEVEVGAEATVPLRLDSPVLPELQIEPSNDKVGVSAKCVIGACEITVAGLSAGESVITVTATANGYEAATAIFPVTVNLRPLEWSSLPDEIEVEVGQEATVELPLSSAVLPELQIEPSDDNVAISAECVIGVCEITVLGLSAGESAVTVTAMADGYETATATIPVMVNLRTLEWSSLPDEIEVEVGERVTVELRLSNPVLPELQLEASDDIVSVSAECATGACELTVVGLSGGESLITVTATADGYTEAVGEIDVIVEDAFDLSVWRELVFDAFDCPNGFTSERCHSRWGERTVEDRITAVLPVAPDFHILTQAATRAGRWRFTRQQIDTIEDAIHDAVEQLTGSPFAGRITTGTRLKDQYGWVDIVPLGNEFWDGRAVCGAASVGATEGLILINTDRLDSCSLLALTMHEIGHALGFYHVLNLGDYLMSPTLTEIPAVFTEEEEFHARLAYELGRGARYTPDPRKIATRSYLTTEAFSIGSVRTLEAIPLGEMIQCPLH